MALASTILVAGIFTASCKKKTTETPDTDTSAASDNSMAETTSNDVVSMAGQASESGSVSYRLGNEDVTALSCATYSATGAQVFTLTFNGSCLDGHTRTGSLTFDYSASTGGATHYRNPGWSCHVTSNNYTIDGNAVTINKTITNTTPNLNAGTNLTWSISGSVSIVKANSGGTVTWNCTRVKTLLNTSDTSVYHGQSIPITWSKAQIGITGNATGTTAKGENFTANITSQLERDMNCSPDPNHLGRHPLVKGSIDFTPGTKATRHIDYGNGNCDLTYTVTINGTTYTLTLP